MKNRNRTGRQKYFSADRNCKNCVYNGGRRKGLLKIVCMAGKGENDGSQN